MLQIVLQELRPRGRAEVMDGQPAELVRCAPANPLYLLVRECEVMVRLVMVMMLCGRGSGDKYALHLPTNRCVTVAWVGVRDGDRVFTSA